MPTEDNSQQWYFIEGSTTLSVIIAPASNPDVALTAVGTAAGGTNTGTGSDSSGNVCVKTRVDGDKSQEWYLELVKHLSETPNTTIAAMKTRFPAGRYWNHEGLSTNNPGGTTNQHCVHAHGNCGNGGHCTCNVESGAIQCAGYSNKVIKDAYGGIITVCGQYAIYKMVYPKTSDRETSFAHPTIGLLFVRPEHSQQPNVRIATGMAQTTHPNAVSFAGGPQKRALSTACIVRLTHGHNYLRRGFHVLF